MNGVGIARGLPVKLIAGKIKDLKAILAKAPVNALQLLVLGRETAACGRIYDEENLAPIVRDGNNGPISGQDLEIIYVIIRQIILNFKNNLLKVVQVSLDVTRLQGMIAALYKVALQVKAVAYILYGSHAGYGVPVPVKDDAAIFFNELINRLQGREENAAATTVPTLLEMKRMSSNCDRS